MRYLREKPAWWVIAAAVLVLGWAASLCAVIFYYQYLGDLIAQHQNSPQELMDRWANDGAKHAFALLFGWLYALIYSLPWLLLYFIAVTIKKALQESSKPVPGGP